MAEARRRVFVALWPDPAAADRLDELSAAAHAVCGGRRMRRDTLHLTLDFIGDVAASRLPDIGAALAGVRGEAFRLCVDSIGYWKHNRIVWAGCRAWPAALDALVGELRHALAGIGLASGREGAAFFPHVTLLRKGHAAERLPPVEPIDWPVTEWVLVESDLTGSGAAYRRLAAWPLT